VQGFLGRNHGKRVDRWLASRESGSFSFGHTPKVCPSGVFG
jgi:hypothetical protein